MPKHPVTPQDIDDLGEFLPLFDVPGRSYADWPNAYPNYPPDVKAFYKLAGSACWSEFGYSFKEAGEMIADLEGIASATLLEVKYMLTYCVRSERFGDGNWEFWLQSGRIVALLRRLQVLRATFLEDIEEPEN